MLMLPPFGSGQRIGLFGGSFNPAHQGHVAVARFALKTLRLDWVWWLVSPQNPLKDAGETASYDARLEQTRLLASHPRFVVTDIERQIGARYTADTIAALRPFFSKARFCWIMGADSLANLHHWHHWTYIAESLPLAVLARPGFTLRALGSPASLRYESNQMDRENAGGLCNHKAPAWTFVPMPLRSESSTAIRLAIAARNSSR
jgi:nicotinate-nucleotide adenylyltransferase